MLNSSYRIGWQHGNYFTLPAAEYWMVAGKSTLVQVVGLYTEIHWVGEYSNRLQS